MPKDTIGLGLQARAKQRIILNRYEREYKGNDFVILKIELSKLGRKIKFWQDDEHNSKDAYWTMEFIPHWAIVDVIPVWKPKNIENALKFND